MKNRYFFVLLFIVCMTASSKAQVMDSLWADSVIVSNGIVSPEYSLHDTDKVYAKLDNGALLDLGFRTKADTTLLRTIKKKAVLNVYCKKDLTVDSSAGELIFYKTDAEGAILYQSQAYMLGDGLNTINAPDSEFSFAEFQLSGLGDPKGAKSFLIDAVQLIQPQDIVGVKRGPDMAATAIGSNYPNPFFAGSTGTNLVVTLSEDADVSVVVTDISGKEAARAGFGMLTKGSQTLPLTIAQPGVYFVRLIAGGNAFGAPYKIVAQ
jgi:hypothetical protein